MEVETFKAYYITKDKTGLVQLWNNEPEYNKSCECFQAWVEKGVENEIPIDVTANNAMREYVTFEESPKKLFHKIRKTY